jgi:guanylate kinase
MIQKQRLLVVTAPSGSGKTTIVRHLLKKYDALRFVISATNRSRRANEINGADYYFLTTERFHQLVEEGAFLEWEEVYSGQFYGSLAGEVTRINREGHIPIFDIDVKGALNLKKQYGDQALVLFIRPPSPEILEERLRGRKTEDEASLNKRIARAHLELTYESHFDHTIVNDQLDKALEDAEALIEQFLSRQ